MFDRRDARAHRAPAWCRAWCRRHSRRAPECRPAPADRPGGNRCPCPAAPGLSVIMTFLPVCRPTPVARIEFRQSSLAEHSSDTTLSLHGPQVARTHLSASAPSATDLRCRGGATVSQRRMRELTQPASGLTRRLIRLPTQKRRDIQHFLGLRRGAAGHRLQRAAARWSACRAPNSRSASSARAPGRCACASRCRRRARCRLARRDRCPRWRRALDRS